MSRRPARFTEADLYRAAKAAKRAGMVVEAKPDGTICIIPSLNDMKSEVDVTFDEAPPAPLM